MSAWHETARAMKAADPTRTNRSIADELGVSVSTVWNALHPEAVRERSRRGNARRAAVKRAWENEHDRHPCACGALMGAGAHRAGATRCERCERAARIAAKNERWAQIAALYLSGIPLRDIAVELNTTTNALSTHLACMRADGWDLPYRRAGWGRTAA
jgi:DNA-binding CsgD family transcriptional regulator